jgi:hypothetical protein
MRIISEGVFVLASAKGLAKEYINKEFDYDFPNGISKLLNEHIIIALTTSDGDNLIVDFKKELDSNESFEKEINQYIKLDEQDDLLILSHAEFTQICDENGDYKEYKWPIQKIEQLDSGIYHVNIRVENLRDRFDEFNAYFRLTICINKTNDTTASMNEVIDISN